jgi:hypothetical protein
MAQIKLFKVITRAWAEVILALSGGLALSTRFEAEDPNHWFRVLHDIGIGLVVAAIVTVVWNLSEFTEFFERFAQGILVRDEYLRRLSDDALKELRLRAAKTILDRYVDNEAFNRTALEHAIDQQLYGKLLPAPGKLSGMYREDYTDNVTLEFITVSRALEDLGERIEHLSDSDRATAVLRVTTITTYRMISPILSNEVYEVPFNGKAADLDLIPMNKRIQLFVGANEAQSKKVEITTTNNPEGGMKYSAEKPAKVTLDCGACKVWLKIVEYRSPTREPYSLNTMSWATKGLDVEVRMIGPGPNLVFEAGVIASGESEEITHIPGGLKVGFSEWLLENHGYFLWWWEPKSPATVA